ncbi:uncharacterized protein LOC124537579 [Vanessa cardui]|uniref:uncharacterized protein LOC124537579 n=1 Tax=Vanessa cardui TaxID=171605 RepID=UPI001F141F87|nr:uncharacterized protein LOC124537579 [Vanessa cardui]
MDNVENKESNESETNVAKIKSKIRGKKRKRLDSDTSTDGDDVLPENTLEFESNVHASAIKNNLDDESVRKILKKVVTNDHVLALVKLREEEEDSGTEESLRPKITRSKAKELMKVSRSKAPWNLELTPINHIPVKTRPEVKALIAQELPEDEDDEEYEPTPDDVMSDDDHISFSDLDSQPRTPATPLSQTKTSPKIVQDGPFKVPQDLSKDVCRKLDMNQEEEATIALRTRSKLSLSSTSIEHIESSFVPPDYLPVPDVDDLWNEFLTECLNPAPNTRNEDDDETDPEYSVAADPDANEEDEEALENSIIKISKKELNDLVTELFHVMPPEIDVQLDNIQGVLGEGNTAEVTSVWEGKQEPLSDEESKVQSVAAKITGDRRDSKTRFSIGKTEPDDIDEHDQTLVIDTSVQIKEVPENMVEESPSATPATEAVSVREVSAGAPEPSASAPQRASPPPAPPAPPAAPAPAGPPAAPAPAAAPARPSPPAPLRAFLQAPALTLTIQVDDTCKMYPQQMQLLQQQLRQHIQLAASNFLQLFVHPMHWSYAPKYKEYLMTLNEMTLTNPKSVVNVCNLKPAIDLVESWECSLSDNTPDAVAMVEFIQKEVEKCRRRTTQNSVYFAEFPELFKKVVANSSVFLYPYLLPPVPYRAEFKHKRFSYLRSEDELIVLGLDQFWRYVEDNPQLFKRPSRPHPRRRWGLTTAARLVCRHTLPALTLRALLAHLKTAQRGNARDSPIVVSTRTRTRTRTRTHTPPRASCPHRGEYTHTHTHAHTHTAARLVCRHTLPALTLRALLAHLKTAQRGNARDSPIVPHRGEYTHTHTHAHTHTAARLVCRHTLPALTLRALLAHLKTAQRGNARDSPIVPHRGEYTHTHAHAHTHTHTAARLVCRHTLPALTLRALLAHLKTAQRGNARDSPIVNYFKNHTIEPVKHKLLPYNPNITLYEQPEFEMPRLWIRYLAKSSKRFKDHLHRRTTQPPAGVEIEMGKNIESPQRNPLPIDFTKPIYCDRINMLPPKPKPVLVDKVDVHIQKSNENVTNNTTFLVASNLYTIVNTSTGTQLVPLQVTNTVDSASTPICSPAVKNTNANKNDIDTESGNKEQHYNNINNIEVTNSNLELRAEANSKESEATGHCICCNLFKKIRRKRQTFITDYFNSNKKRQDNVCGCRQKKYPRITNKLRLLVNNFKTLSKTVYNEVVTKIDKCKMAEACSNDSSANDLVSALLFQIKLVERTNLARNNCMKKTLHTAFARFDVENDDPVKLSERLFEIFDVELADMYKEFLGFLTAEQADKLDQFKDYFVRNCIQELVVKIEEQVLDNDKRRLILENLKEIILDNTSKPCELCCKLLNCTRDYPALAQYIYSLFPHRWKEKLDPISDSEINDREDDREGMLTICEETNATADYEADNSSRFDHLTFFVFFFDEEVSHLREISSSEPQLVHVRKPDKIVTTIKYEKPEASEMTVDEMEHRKSESSDNMSMLIMSEDECIKTEVPEWKRDEDKLILEVLKQCISPNEIKDKTIIELIEDKNVVNMIADSLCHKSYEDIKERILYLLEILVNDKDK